MNTEIYRSPSQIRIVVGRVALVAVEGLPLQLIRETPKQGGAHAYQFRRGDLERFECALEYVGATDLEADALQAEAVREGLLGSARPVFSSGRPAPTQEPKA